MSSKLEIIDAVARERMIIERFGGDVFFIIKDNTGKILHSFGMEMKRNDKDTFLKIEELFNKVKEYLKERPGDFYGNNELVEKDE